jgi:cytochrome c peroxidase
MQLRNLLPAIGLSLVTALAWAVDDVAASRVVAPISGRPVDLVAVVRTPPLGLPEVPQPDRNPVTGPGVKLGRKLFFDRRLSFNSTLSCAMCHVPEQGFTQNELRTPVGIEGRFVKRNAPSLLNVAFRQALFHDGREDTLENQVWQPLLRSNEMANPSIGFVLNTIRQAPDYAGLFEAAFEQEGLTAETVGMALASYQRALLAADSPFDRWYFGGEPDAMSAAAVRGWTLFRDSGCIGCHTVGEHHAQFTDDAFYDTGIGYARTFGQERPGQERPGQERPGQESSVKSIRLAPGLEVVPEVQFDLPRASDLGRYEATGRSADRWLYRVPTLRNVAITAPYMHDGSLPDLEAVVSHYQLGGIPHPGLDPRIRPLSLSGRDREDLIRFLQSLTGSSIERLVRDARSQAIGDTNR